VALLGGEDDHRLGPEQPLRLAVRHQPVSRQNLKNPEKNLNAGKETNNQKCFFFKSKVLLLKGKAIVLFGFIKAS
jgi:hypothetical protein